MAKGKVKNKVFEVIENTPGGRLLVNPTGDNEIEVLLQSFGECSQRLIVVGARVVSIEPVEETITYRLPEKELDQATGVEGVASRQETETIECVLARLDNGKTIQLSQAPLSIKDYRVVDGRLEWPADDRPHI